MDDLWKILWKHKLHWHNGIFFNRFKRKLEQKNYLDITDIIHDIHPTETITLRGRKEPIYPRTHHEVNNETNIRRSQKVIKNEKGELELKSYPERKSEKKTKFFRKIKGSICKEKQFIDYDKRICCQKCVFIVNKQKNSRDRKSGRMKLS